eukprot:scaffold239626_cov36-Tisochrysis_lutea.AAC.4
MLLVDDKYPIARKGSGALAAIFARGVSALVARRRCIARLGHRLLQELGSREHFCIGDACTVHLVAHGRRKLFGCSRRRDLRLRDDP